MKCLPMLVLVFTFLFLPQAWAERQLLDQVVAVVNDEAITQSELDTILRPLYQEYKNEYSEIEVTRMLNEARQKLLNQLIEDHLAFQEAKTRKIEVDESVVEHEMDEFKKRFKDEAEMEEALKKSGFTANDMRERVRRRNMIEKLHDMEIRSRIVISPLEIQEYYDSHHDEFVSVEQIHVRSITIKKDSMIVDKGIEDEVAKAKMEGLRKKILSGESFGKLAAEFSEDTNAKKEGLSDWIKQGDMIPAINDVIFKLKPGEISKIIETPMGFHLFRMEDRKEGKTLSFDEAREIIFDKIFQKKSTQRFQEWMEELKHNAYISIR